MKLTDEREMSWWAYEQCRDVNDTPEMRNLITSSLDAYRYCRWVKDREEMWGKITDSGYAYLYCRYVKDRPEVRKYVK